MVASFSVSAVPDERLIGPLRCRSASGFRNVYPWRVRGDGVLVYHAKVKRGGVLRHLPGSNHTQPHVCAVHVARWYEREFGANWRDALRTRWGRNPWRVRWSAKYGGYVASVWVTGHREEVVELTRWGSYRRLRSGTARLRQRWARGREWGNRSDWRPTDAVQVFPTREAARAGIAGYLRRLYGADWRPLLWRGAGGALAA